MSDSNYISGLQRYDILDTQPERQFDRIVQMAARLFDAPFAALSFIDDDRQWFKARYGFAFDTLSCTGGLCLQTVNADGGIVVLDTMLDKRLRGDPLVVGAPALRFYAGAGIHAGDGQIIGTLFVGDDRSRSGLHGHAMEELQMLARLAEAEIECRDLRLTVTDAMDRFRELAQVSSDWVWETDREHRLVGLFSDRPCMSGIASNVMGKRRWEYLDSRILEGSWQEHMAIVQAHAPFNDVRYEVVEKDGVRRTFQISGKPVYDSRDRFVGYRGTGLEITGQLLAEARLAEIEAAHRESQKLESLGLIASGIVHDFNNILSIIVLKLEAMSDELPPESPQQNRIAGALKATDRATALTSHILGFAKRRASSADDVRIDDVVETMADLLQTALPDGVTLQTSAAMDLPPCRLDRSGLEAALLNLVVNARDAMPSGGRIDITTESRSAANDEGMKSGDWVVVSVRDSGTGMSPEVQARIFEPFFTTKKDSKGTGLGLSTIRDFVHRSGGFLTVESGRGLGTTIAMHYPIAACPAVVPNPDVTLSQAADDASGTKDSPGLLGRTRRRAARWREAAIAIGRQTAGIRPFPIASSGKQGPSSSFSNA